MRRSASKKRRLTPEQEQKRLEGLRILARIIVRHYLANPGVYVNGPSPTNGLPADEEEGASKEGAA